MHGYLKIVKPLYCVPAYKDLTLHDLSCVLNSYFSYSGLGWGTPYWVCVHARICKNMVLRNRNHKPLVKLENTRKNVYLILERTHRIYVYLLEVNLKRNECLIKD